MDLLKETFELVIVRRDHHSGLYSIEMPSQRETQRYWRILGIKAPVPEPGHQFWADLWKMTEEKLPILQAIAAQISSYGKQPTIQENLMPSTSTSRAAEYNARHKTIREMSGTAAIAECARLSIPVTEHPTNSGITAMRAKNALYARARHQHPHSVSDAA